MKKLAAVILGTLLLMSSPVFADGTTGENVNGCGAGSTCGECSNQGARTQPEATDDGPSSPVLTDEQKERGV